MSEMPRKGSHLAMLIVSFVLGVLWGLLGLGPFKRMNAAVAAGDAETAWANAKKVELFFWIAIVLNVIFILISMFAQ